MPDYDLTITRSSLAHVADQSGMDAVIAHLERQGSAARGYALDLYSVTTGWYDSPDRFSSVKAYGAKGDLLVKLT